jgi:hypothetical protein
MADQGTSKQSTLVTAGGCITGVGLGLTILFVVYAGLSIFLACGMGQAKPETSFVENLMLSGVLLLTLLIAGVIYPIGWLIYGVYFAVIIAITMLSARYFASSSRSPNSIGESKSSENDAGVAKIPTKTAGADNVPVSLIMIVGFAVIWLTAWGVTRDPWWFFNGIDAWR